MNEIEKAIKFFRYLANGVPKSNLLFGKPKDYENKMQLLAIQALQEKAERETGCEYCKTPSKYLLVWDDVEPRIFGSVQGEYLQVFDEDYPGSIYNVSINYCPMCGRKLTDHIGEANNMVKEDN